MAWALCLNTSLINIDELSTCRRRQKVDVVAVDFDASVDELLQMLLVLAGSENCVFSLLRKKNCRADCLQHS